MKVAIASDHAGFLMKQDVAEYLRKNGYEVSDLGTNNQDPVDYPDFSEAVGRAVIEGKVERGDAEAELVPQLLLIKFLEFVPVCVTIIIPRIKVWNTMI